jgi:hypothetical protein
MSILGGIGNQDTKLGSTIAGGTSNRVTGGVTDAIAGGNNETLSGATNYLSRIGNATFNP